MTITETVRNMYQCQQSINIENHQKDLNKSVHAGNMSTNYNVILLTIKYRNGDCSANKNNAF